MIELGKTIATTMAGWIDPAMKAKADTWDRVNKRHDEAVSARQVLPRVPLASHEFDSADYAVVDGWICFRIPKYGDLKKDMERISGDMELRTIFMDKIAFAARHPRT